MSVAGACLCSLPNRHVGRYACVETGAKHDTYLIHLMVLQDTLTSPLTTQHQYPAAHPQLLPQKTGIVRLSYSGLDCTTGTERKYWEQCEQGF